MIASECAKTRYPTRADAKDALAALNRRDRGPTPERTMYFCHPCQGWHLTSKHGRSLTDKRRRFIPYSPALIRADEEE